MSNSISHLRSWSIYVFIINIKNEANEMKDVTTSINLPYSEFNKISKYKRIEYYLSSYSSKLIIKKNYTV